MRYLVAALVCSAAAFGQGPNTSPAALESTFSQATLSSPPVGQFRGTVLTADGPFPRVKARLQGVVWRGKVFTGDGTMTNRWLGGVRAVSAGTTTEPSWADGEPVLAITYPKNAPVFGGDRDELREVSPGVWLGRSYDTATGQPKNWFLLRAR